MTRKGPEWELGRLNCLMWWGPMQMWPDVEVALWPVVTVARWEDVVRRRFVWSLRLMAFGWGIVVEVMG